MNWRSYWKKERDGSLPTLKEQITRRYLKHRSSLYREALSRLIEEDEIEPADDGNPKDQREESLEKETKPR